MLDNLSRRDSRWSTTDTKDKMIIRIFEQSRTVTLCRAQSLLDWKGISVSLMTINPRLIASGYKHHSTAIKPFLSERHIEKCLLSTAENIDRNFSNVVFTDEASFWAWSTHKQPWSILGKPRFQLIVKIPAKVHAGGCFSKQVFGTLYPFTSTLNAERMKENYQKCFLKSTRKWFGTDLSAWILQEDNDPKQRCRLFTKWSITTLGRPAQSPDINPIFIFYTINSFFSHICNLFWVSKSIRMAKLC